MKRLFLTLAAALPLMAYIDVTPIEIGEHPALSGSTSLSLSNRRGNTKKSEVGADINVRYDNNESSAFWLFGGYKYSDTEGKSIENRGSAHLRYLHKISAELYLESFLQSENNRINGIKSRLVAGGDIRWRIFDSTLYGKVYAAAGPIYEQIRFTDPQKDPLQRNIRVSSYLFYTKSFLTGARFNSYIYYQPKPQKFSDYNLYSLAELQTPVYKNFFLLLSLKYDYDSTPPTSVEKVDMEQRVSFMWKF
ncbi:MAG: DUF481 domain-containing protein [Hydrogenimonas sp.]|nr:DUF481 domain-containing protein [Hydrogenimonas sp.]